MHIRANCNRLFDTVERGAASFERVWQKDYNEGYYSRLKLKLIA
jgi:hypothetical protein